MAARVNKKLLILLVLAVLSVVGIGGFVYAYQLNQNAARNARIGDEYLAEGDLNRARDYFGRAVRKEPGNREYLQKYENVLLQIVPQTQDRANELFQQRLSVLRHGAQHHPLDADDHLRLLEELHRVARLTNGAQYYELLESSAGNMVDRVHIDDPKREYGRLYRAIGRFNQRIYSADDLDEAENDLRVFLDAHPDSDLGWASLAIAQWTMSELYALDGQTRRAEEKMNHAQSTLRQAIETAPDGLEVAKAQLLDVLQRRDRLNEEISEEETVEAVDRVLSRISTDTPPWSAVGVMTIMRNARSDELRQRVLDVFEPYLEAHADHPVVQLQMARTAYEWGMYDEAEKHVRALLEAEPRPVGILSVVQFDLKVAAAGLLSDLEYQRWVNAAGDQQGRQQAVDRLQAARDEVGRLTSETATNLTLARAEGKLAFAKNDHVRAVEKFELLIRESSRQSRMQNIENFAFAIHSHEQLGNVGLAHTRVRMALDLDPPARIPLQLKQAELELKMRQYEDAKETLAEVLKVVPENEAALRLMALAESGGDSSAIASSNPAINAINEAQQAWRNNEPDQARSILLEALDAEPQNADLLLMLARLELNLQNRETALEYADRGLQIVPDSVPLQVVRAQAQNEDRISALNELARSVHPDDAAERSAAIVVGLQSMRDAQQRLINQQQAQGNADAVSEAQAYMTRIAEHLETTVNALEQANADHPVLVEYRINKAIANEQWQQASTFVEKAARLNLDGAQGDLFRARLQLAQGNNEAAVRTLLDLTTRMDWSTNAWQSLGYAYEQLGNFTEAARAYQQAYRNNPTRLDVVQSYARVLIQTGELVRSLDVMRDARNLAPNNTNIRNTWLELEAGVGDPVIALKERRKWYEDEPDNRTNAIRLAALLGRLAPDRQSITDASGQPRFNERAWIALSATERQQVVNEARKSWQDEADSIVNQVAADEPDTLEIAALRAELLRARGNVSGGEAILRQFIQSQPEEQRTGEMFVVLGRYLADANREAEAIQAFEQGLPYQDEATPVVDIALGDLYFHQGRKEDALRHFRKVLAFGENASVHLRAVEALIDLGQLEEARTLLDDAVDENGASFTTWLLSSAILEGEGDALLAEGKEVEARFKYDEFRNALDNAQRLRPDDVLPKLRLARHHMRVFEQTGERRLLDDAMRALAEADQILAEDPRVSLVRVDVLRAMGDMRGAVSELTRLLASKPGESQARALLVSMHVSQGDPDAAIDVVQKGISHNETLPLWHMQLGDLYLNYKQDARSAIQPYMTALTLAESADLVKRVARARLLAGDKPLDVVEFLQRYPQYQRSDTGVLALLVQALAMANQPNAIESVLRQLYARLGDLIDQGVLDANAIGTWFRVARDGLAGLPPSKVEALLMELTSQQPSGYELSSMAFLYRMTGQPDDVSRALQLQRQALEKIADLPAVAQSPYYYDYGTMLIETGQFQDAADAFRKSFELNDEHALAYNNYAYLLCEHLGNPQGAIEPARQAASLQPDNASIQDTLGWVHYRNGNLEEAESAIRRSLDVQRSPDVLVHLAEVQIARDDADQAMRTLREVEEMQPGEALKQEVNRLLQQIRTTQGRGQ